jgi:hypothetical protein
MVARARSPGWGGEAIPGQSAWLLGRLPAVLSSGTRPALPGTFLALGRCECVMANVFISYRSADLPEAERLAVELRRRGHVVWLDGVFTLATQSLDRLTEGSQIRHTSSCVILMQV